ncbi:RNase H family protein [Desulfobacula sp.]|uniref:ribonuclease HI n=1 Tax=Desulfobacula sp. TaxID=2593537 RepID=UPI002609AA0F|nr:RNase H family protein [Desulfobacula sp.]
MTRINLFIDGSVNPQIKVGYGAFLVINEKKPCLETLKGRVVVRKFNNTSATKLEIQTLLWALNTIQPSGERITVFTDSQNIVGLPARRNRFEQNDYRSRKNRHIKYYLLYQSFFDLIDQLECNFIKVKGHKRSHQKNEIDQYFSLVDKASRKALRQYLI